MEQANSLSFPTTFTFKVIVRRKSQCISFLKRKYGEEKLLELLASNEPLIVSGVVANNPIHYIVVII